MDFLCGQLATYNTDASPNRSKGEFQHLVVQQKDDHCWEKLPAKKLFTNLNGDICQQQTEFLIWEMQRYLQLKIFHQILGDFLKPHPITCQQNMRFVFTYFNMQGLSPFR